MGWIAKGGQRARQAPCTPILEIVTGARKGFALALALPFPP